MVGTVYTAITNGYDDLKPIAQEPGLNYLCFTDDLNLRGGGWNTQIIKPEPRIDRKIKILYNEFINSDYSIWVDASIEVRGNLKEFIAEFLESDFDMMSATHLDRDCIYDEAIACKQTGKDDPAVIDRQINRYRLEGYPAHSGLTANTTLIRKHNSKVEKLMKAWWEEVEKGSVRDQLSFNYVLSKSDVKVMYYSQSVIKDSKYFFWNGQHKL